MLRPLPKGQLSSTGRSFGVWSSAITVRTNSAWCFQMPPPSTGGSRKLAMVELPLQPVRLGRSWSWGSGAGRTSTSPSMKAARWSSKPSPARCISQSRRDRSDLGSGGSGGGGGSSCSAVTPRLTSSPKSRTPPARADAHTWPGTMTEPVPWNIGWKAARPITRAASTSSSPPTRVRSQGSGWPPWCPHRRSSPAEGGPWGPAKARVRPSTTGPASSARVPTTRLTASTSAAVATRRTRSRQGKPGHW